MTPPSAPLAVEPVTLDKAGGEVRLSVEEYKGCPLADLRYWYRAADGELRPSPRGVALPLARWRELVHAVLLFDERLQAAQQAAAATEP